MLDHKYRTMRNYGFEKLEVWQLSRNFGVEIYKLTHKFPKEEKYGIISQIRRSALSVSANIAEGSGRISGKEQARFSEIAYGSLLETLNHLLIAEKLGLISKNTIDKHRLIISEISNKLNALRKSQLKKNS